MKKITTVLLIVFCASVGLVSAQDKKTAAADKKRAKEAKKSMDPVKFKEMYESYNKMKAESNAKQKKIESLLSQVDNANASLASKNDELTQAKQDCGPIETIDATAKASYSHGVVYKVQIGAYRNIDLSEFMGNSSFLTTESSSDGIKKYILGHFRQYKVARNFKDYVREMGVKDAFIVPVEDNARIEINDALKKSGESDMIVTEGAAGDKPISTSDDNGDGKVTEEGK